MSTSKNRLQQRVARKLCGDVLGEALRAFGYPASTRSLVSSDFTAEERFRVFRRVMHGQVWPGAGLFDFSRRQAFTWSYSVWTWRHGGRKRFMAEVEKAARQELAEVDYASFDLSPLRGLIGNDGDRYCRLLQAADAAEMAVRLGGMRADLMVLDRKLDRIARSQVACSTLSYRVDFYDNSYEAVIHGGKGRWIWPILIP